jgi:uridine kinase
MIFENLVVGHFNELAVKVSEMVMESPGRDYPVLIIQGGFGSGKSSLVKAIENRAANKLTVKTITATNIMNEIIQAMKDHTYADFFKTLESLDILIIEDLQELSNRTGTQHTIHKAIKYRVANKKQTIITTSMPIVIIDGMTEEFGSFLKSSLVVEIHEPSFEDKILITKRIANSRNLSLYDDVATFVAEICAKNLRKIDGAILKLEAVSKILKKEITLELAKEHLMTRHLSTRINQTEISDILEEEANEIVLGTDVINKIEPVESDPVKLLNEAVRVVRVHRVASASFLQRQLGISYNKASGLIEEMEKREIISPAMGSKPRKVLIPATEDAYFPERTVMIKRTPISNIISRYISLEKKGENLQGICPFHADDKLSLKVNDSKGMFKCFVCGAGGDAITFVKDFNKIEFNEAIREIENWKG